MGIFDFLRGRNVETKESAVGQVIFSGLPNPIWSGRNYAAFAKEGYSMNVVAYQAINKVAEAVASVEWEVWEGDTQMTSHPALDLIRHPNPNQSGAELMQAKTGFQLIAGNSYDEAVMASGNEPRELYTLRPDRMKIIPSGSGVSGYEYKVGPRAMRWDAEDGLINHSKFFHPTDDFYGLSPIEAGSFAIDQHNEAMKWVQSLLQNAARPSGALITADDKYLTDEQADRLKAELEENYTGSANSGRPMLLDGGLDWKEMGLSPTDMGIIESKHSSARDVCLAFGVPPMLMGIPGDNTYANYKEARLAFWEDTVLPLVGLFMGDWAMWLSLHYAKPFEFRPNLDKIPAIAEKRQELWAMADKATDLTIDERRALKGYEPIDGGALVSVDPAKLTAVAQAVADGLMPAETGKAILMTCPGMTEQMAGRIIDPAANFAPAIDFTSPELDDEQTE